MLKRSAVLELVVDRLYPMWRYERDRLDVLDAWLRWTHEDLKLPRDATDEHRMLAELGKTPWLGHVVTTTAQALYMDGFRSPGAQGNAAVWGTWEANDLDSRQIAIHRATLAYGVAYATVLPGSDATGRRSVIRGVSPRKMLAVYADPAEDEWPMYAMRVDPNGRESYMLQVIEDDVIHMVSLGASGDEPAYLEWRAHNTGVPPVVRYARQLDLDGRYTGEIEPLINVAKRANKTVYDRLLTQHFNSWKIRTIAGIDLTQGPVDTDKDGQVSDEERYAAAERAKMRLRQSDLLTAKDPATKFGTLDETPLDGFINAYGSDLDTMAALGQMPVTAMNASTIANISADAMVELRAGWSQKIIECQKMLGKSHAQALRLAAYQEGNDVEAADYRSRATWRDMNVYRVGEIVDALGKGAAMLGIPPESLWPLFPGAEAADVDEWKIAARKQRGQQVAQEIVGRARERAGVAAPVAGLNGAGTR